MPRLDTYRTALTAADPQRAPEALAAIVEAQDRHFAEFVVAHGLGPLWHSRSGRAEFRESRLAAEALFLVQQEAITAIGTALSFARIPHALIKGAANRLLLYANPALRACHDIDVLVHPDHKVEAAAALVTAGFVPVPEARSISRTLVLRRANVDVDLHWGLLREGRLRADPTPGMLARRQQVGKTWVLGDEDALFALLVHPAFAKHLDGWDMGLHRVLDILEWLRHRPADWPAVRARLAEAGVRSAAWATLTWVELLAGPQAPAQLAAWQADLAPGSLRRAWLGKWLEADLPARLAGVHWLRLLAFSALLHDSPGDVLRALAGRRRARARAGSDLREFAGVPGWPDSRGREGAGPRGDH